MVAILKWRGDGGGLAEVKWNGDGGDGKVEQRWWRTSGVEVEMRW